MLIGDMPGYSTGEFAGNYRTAATLNNAVEWQSGNGTIESPYTVK